MIKKIYILCLVFLMPAVLLAQLNEPVEPSLLSKENSIFSSKPDFGLQLGSSFSNGFGGSSFFTQSIAPHMQLQPHRNFRLIVGTTLSTTSFGGNAPVMGFAQEQLPQRYFSNTVYAFGAYQLNPRLTLTGGAWTEQNNLNLMQNQMNPQAFDLNARGMMMGMDYKITENLRFGAELSFSKGQNPFSPYSGYGNQYSSPFHRRTPW